MSRSASSAQLGSTLRNVVMQPAAGFDAAFRRADRRERSGRRPAEGLSPFIFAATGGAGLMLAWLKVGTLLGLRDAGAGHRVWAYVFITMLLGALIALAALSLWGAAGTAVLRSLGTEASPRNLRIVGGLSGIPQIIGLLVLLPLDAVISGPASFTAQRISDSVSEVWAAFSVAFAVGLVVWSLMVLVRGMQTLTGLRLSRAAGLGALAIVCIGIVATGLLAGAAVIGSMA